MVWTAFLSLLIELTKCNRLCHCLHSVLDIKLQVTRKSSPLSIFLFKMKEEFPLSMYFMRLEKFQRSLWQEKNVSYFICLMSSSLEVQVDFFFLAKWRNLAILHQLFIILFIWGSNFSWTFWSFSPWKLNIKLTQTGICWSHWCHVLSYTSIVLLTGIEMLKTATFLMGKWELELLSPEQN